MPAETVRDALAVKACGEAAPAPLAPPSRGELYEHISATYRLLRLGLAAVAVALPVLLWIGTGQPRPSISDYYHAGGWMRDPFVGSLSAIGVFLVLYKGYSSREDVALDLAGVAAVVVALVPTDRREVPGVRVELAASGLVHMVAAVCFFLLIAYVCVFRSGDTLALMDEERRRGFRRGYRLLGAAMLAAPAAAWAVRYLPGAAAYPYVFFAELAGVLVFAAFWIVKSREIGILERG